MKNHLLTAVLGVVALLACQPSNCRADRPSWKPNPARIMINSTRLGCGEPGHVYKVPKVPHVPQPIVNAFDKHVYTIGTCKPAQPGKK